MQGILLIFLEFFAGCSLLHVSFQDDLCLTAFISDLHANTLDRSVSSSSWVERFDLELLPFTPSSSADGPKSLLKCGLAKTNKETNSYVTLFLMIAIIIY